MTCGQTVEQQLDGLPRLLAEVLRRFGPGRAEQSLPFGWL